MLSPLTRALLAQTRPWDAPRGPSRATHASHPSYWAVQTGEPSAPHGCFPLLGLSLPHPVALTLSTESSMPGCDTTLLEGGRACNLGVMSAVTDKWHRLFSSRRR